jgi:uncharacterized protein (DUF1501 family)
MPSSCSHCADYSRSELMRRGFAQAGRGLPSIEAGMPDPAGTGLSRRDFLARSAGLALTLYGASALAPAAFEEGIAAASAAAPAQPVLISIWLSGGIDSLSLLAPVDDATYRSLRPTLKIVPSADALDVFSEDTRLHWHPKATPLRDLHRAGKVTVVPGIGWDSSNGSHFVSRHFWEVGELNEGGRVGWLGRYLDREGAANNPLQGLSLESHLSPTIAAGTAPVAALKTPTNYLVGFRDVAGARLDAAWTAAAQLASQGVADDAREQSGDALTSMLMLRNQLAPIQGVTPAPEGGAAYPAGTFGGQLKLVAEMLGRGLPLKCVTVQGPGGYDTHSSQGAILPNNIDVLSKALAAFQADVDARGLGDRVLVHVWSEFGRRVRENGGGTDHGAGGVSLFVGNRVTGRMIGEWPGLETLDPLGNLRSTADFRALYCSMLEQWFGADPTGIVPNAASFGRPQIIAP